MNQLLNNDRPARTPIVASMSRRVIVALKSYFGPYERVFKRFTIVCKRLLEVFQRLFSPKADFV